MTNQSKIEVARFETTRRLLSQLVNEGLCQAFLESEEGNDAKWLNMTGNEASPDNCTLKVRFLPGKLVTDDAGRIESLVRPNQLKPPVLLGCQGEPPLPELDPGTIYKFTYPWFGGDAGEELDARDRLIRELRSAAANQETWLDIEARLPQLSLFSPAIDWEKSLTKGHPTHPLHKTLDTTSGLPALCPTDIWDMLSPEILFLSVPRSQIITSGPFEEILATLLDKLDIERETEDRVIIPSLARQHPAILSRFSGIRVVGSDRASAQASTRTVTLRRELQFGYHLKLALAYQITSAVRTITPWTALGSPEYSDMLHKLLPADIWVFREVAAVTGAQRDFDEAKHISCVLREDLELRANAQDESLIIAAALSQSLVGDMADTQAASLIPIARKRQWFQEYAALLLKLTLQPLVDYGIGIEAHGQNICVRICRRTKKIKGFAVRDFGGIRLHMPTLRSQGFELRSVPPGAATMTDDLREVWSKVHHTLFQSHLGHLIVALGLEEKGGWEIVRTEVASILQPDGEAQSRQATELYQFLMAETMTFKCFVRMRMVGKYRDYVERHLPNVLLY